jgi:hypothetical protein
VVAPTRCRADAEPAGALPPIAYLSPMPGARDLLPQSNVIVRFRSAIGSEFGATPAISVTGSVSGPHTGSLVTSSDGLTLIFNPSHEFAWGEGVSVVVSRPPASMGGGPEPLTSFSFSIATARPPRVDPPIVSELAEALATSAQPQAPRAGATGLDRLTTGPPTIGSSIYAVPAPGALFLSSFTSLAGPPAYLLIVDDFGNPFFYRSQPTSCLDFKVQPNGSLTYYDYGQQKFYVMDTTYTITDSIACGNGYGTDGHELRLLPTGHALLLSYDPHTVDMSVVVPGGNPAATVVGAVIQELDEAHNVVFQWRSWDHFQITDATHEDLTAAFIDYVHANAIEYDIDGNLLLSSRHLDEITKINHISGDVMWRWGGLNNQFTFLDDPDGFSHQHGIRRLATKDLILYDNGNFHTPHYSRASEYRLDEINMTAQLVWQYRNAPDIYGLAMGFAQRLDNGSTLISWGFTSPTLTEVAANGSKIMEMQLPAANWSYRGFRQSWLSDTSVVLDAPHPTIMLSPLSPNPTHGTTSMVVNLLRESPLSVKLYDLHGRLVSDVAEEARHSAGLYRARLDLSDAPAGVYFLHVAAGSQRETRKIVRLR